MNTALSIVFFLGMSLGFSRILAQGKDRDWIAVRLLAGWLCLLPLLVLVNSWFPFSEGGDDEGYFGLAATPISSLADAFDLTRFVRLVEQPGYPWLLSLVYQFAGHDLLAFKALNLALFLMLMPVWYRIGCELESREFGRRMALAVLCLTPLWFYGVFLLKDMTITLLQSVFLLGVVQISRGHGLRSWLLILAATLAIIPFRSPLVLVNVAVISGVSLLTMLRRGKGKRALFTLVFAAVVVGGVVAIASNPDRMAAMGIYTEHRVLGTREMQESVSLRQEQSLMKRGLFPLLYLFSETAGLNPQTWVEFDAGSLRGALALPWIFVGVPFLVLGLLWLMRRDPQMIRSRGFLPHIGNLRFVTTAWGGVLMFILAYLIVSWQLGDTTRWRIPDMPAMAAVALAGWMYGAPRSRDLILIIWIVGSGMLFSLFYLIR